MFSTYSEVTAIKIPEGQIFVVSDDMVCEVSRY
jgi:hypothetical protein